MYLQVSQILFLKCLHNLVKLIMGLCSHCMMRERTYVYGCVYVCLCVCVLCLCVSLCLCIRCVIKGTEGGVGGSVSQVHARAEQSHQLLLIVGDVPLHDLLTGAQEALECLHVYYCSGKERARC